MTWPAHERLLDLTHPRGLALRPDGKSLAFVADPPPAHRAQLHLLDIDHPEAMLTTWHLERDVHLPRWSPDGTLLWLVTATPGGEPNRLEAYDPHDGSRVAYADVDGAIEDACVVDERTLLLRVADPGSDRDGMNLGVRVDSRATDPSDVQPDRAWRRLVRVVLDAGDGGLSTEPLHLADRTVWDFDVRAGLIAFVASGSPLPAGYYDSTLLFAELSSRGLTDVRELDAGPGELACPRIAPDGAHLAVIEGQSIVSGQVRCFSTESGKHVLIPDLDDVTDVGWLSDTTMWFSGWNDVGVQIGTVRDVTTDRPSRDQWTAEATIHGDAGQPALAVAPDAATAYCVWEEPGSPAEVARLRIDRPGRTPLTGFNDDIAPAYVGVDTRRFAWTASDGTPVHGLLLRPADATGPLPLVTLLHGGPTWLWSAAFAPAESNQLALALASDGAAVLLPNPRGSSGRGRAHARAVVGNVGDVDLDDVVTGVRDLIDSGIVDADRMAVMGLSYGGYLSAWAAARTTLFRAAVVMSGVADWLRFAMTSTIGGGYDRRYFPDASIWTAPGREELIGRSPAYHAHEGRTPTLIIHGADDRVTPVDQAEALYRAWRHAGTPVELAVYPREGHELVEPEHRREAARRVRGWLRDWGVLT